MIAPILFVLHVFWMALVFRYAVRKTPPSDPGVAARATLGAAVWVSLWFLILATVNSAFAYLPFLKPAVWIAFLVSYVLIFSEFFGLGYKRLPAILGYHVVGTITYELIRKAVLAYS